MLRYIIKLFLITMFLSVLWGGGCGPSAEIKGQRERQVEELAGQVSRLQIEQRENQRQLEKQSEQLTILRGFSGDRLANLVQVARIEFGRFTRGYDDDKDTIDDGINVYLRLYDSYGDRIKATGVVELEIWDLGGEDGQRQLVQEQIGLGKLQGYWLGGLMGGHYKFKLRWDEQNRPIHKNLTLKCQFKDALNGSVFEIQKLVAIEL